MKYTGYIMSYDDFLEDRAYAAELDDKVRVDYPGHVDEAREFMNKILCRVDKHRYLVFNGQAIDHNMDLGEMGTTHRYIASLLECRDKGQPVTTWYVEGAVRACLGLGFAVIQGGKAD